MLTREPLLWVEPTTVSQQAISQRLNTLPAALFAQLFAELIPACVRGAAHSGLSCRAALAARRRTSGSWILDSSRLEAVFKKSKAVRATDGTVLARHPGGGAGSWAAICRCRSGWTQVPPSMTAKPAKTAGVHPIRHDCGAGSGFSTFASFDALTEAGSAVVGRWTAKLDIRGRGALTTARPPSTSWCASVAFVPVRANIRCDASVGSIETVALVGHHRA
ncbi:MAG: hypothetical protein M9947_05360 [Thermomicrobiales bacterium]|nr:hypothetical protein [Thermomicrobiales bacterium]